MGVVGGGEELGAAVAFGEGEELRPGAGGIVGGEEVGEAVGVGGELPEGEVHRPRLAGGYLRGKGGRPRLIRMILWRDMRMRQASGSARVPQVLLRTFSQAVWSGLMVQAVPLVA